MAPRSSKDTSADEPVSTFDPDTPQQGEEADEETLRAIRERDEANLAGQDGDSERVGARVGGRVGAIAVTAEKNSLATKYGTDAPYGAIFTADPGTTGTVVGEVTGGAPAYARKAITWGAAAGGQVTGTVTFDVPSGVTVAGAGLWSAATGGTFIDGGTVASQTFSAQGTYTLTLTFTQS